MSVTHVYTLLRWANNVCQFDLSLRRWNSDHSMVQAEGLSPDGDTYQNFSAMIFISVLLGLINFGDIAMLGSGPNSCCQQNLKCFDMPLLSLGLFP